MCYIQHKHVSVVFLFSTCIKGGPNYCFNAAEHRTTHTHIIDPGSFRAVARWHGNFHAHSYKTQKHVLYVPIYFRFLFITSVILWVQTCFTYQIKGEILAHLNIIASNFYSERKNYYFLDENQKWLVWKFIFDLTILFKTNVKTNLLSLHIICFLFWRSYVLKNTVKT